MFVWVCVCCVWVCVFLGCGKVFVAMKRAGGRFKGGSALRVNVPKEAAISDYV